MSPRLPQSRLYFKILGIPYLSITLVSKPCVIKASFKSDMTIIYIDIWDTQSNSKAKRLINRYFNIESHIAIIYGTNMNLGVPHYKNCWKWGHMTFMYWVHSAKYVKCNRSHKIKHHRNIVWYYKAKFKINPLRLETKKEKLYIHFFKWYCINCKGEHQADSKLCPF